MELGNKAPALCLWCFDLLHLDGVRITPLTLVERERIAADVVVTGDEHLQFSGDFDEPLELLADVAENGPRGHRFEAAGVGLPLRTDSRLAEGQDRDLACREPRTLGIIREAALAEPLCHRVQRIGDCLKLSLFVGVQGEPRLRYHRSARRRTAASSIESPESLLSGLA